MCVRHHEFADELVLVGKPLRVLVVRRVEQDARVLRRPCREDDDARLLHLLLFSVVVILDAGDAGAGLVGQHARDRGERAHLGLGLSRVLQIGHHRIGERAGRAADRAPAVVDAGRPPLPVDRGHADRGRHEVDAVLLGALQPGLAVGKGLHRRHRIGLARRPPFLLLLGVARHADFGRDLVVERRDIVVGDRPVVRAIVFALDLVVGRQKAREIGEIVQGRAADAPARLARCSRTDACPRG